jgi:capsular polysaccharide transport system permease protein
VSNSSLSFNSREAQSASLLDSFRIQLRVIGALLMREILTRYGRNNIGFLWLLIEPMMFTLVIAGIWTAIKMPIFSQISAVAFAVVSYSTVELWRNMVSRCLNAVEPNHSLLYHRMVKVGDFFIARILLEFVGVSAAFVILATLCVTTGFMAMPVDPLQVAIGWILLAWFGAGLAAFVGASAHLQPLVEKVWGPVALLLLPLSGALVVVNSMPYALQDVLSWFPMVHGLEYVREGYFGPITVFHYDLSYLIGANLLLSLLGLIMVRHAAARVSL